MVKNMHKYFVVIILVFIGCSTEPEDCAGVAGGISVEDECGTCDADSTNDCVQDCDGTWGGAAVEDECATCDTDATNNCIQDCNGDWGGSALEDNCETCDSDLSNDCMQDCYGNWGGSGLITFEKPNYADWTLSENQDSISTTIIITRKDNQSLFNIAQEDGYSNGSPIGTLWARSSTAQAISDDYVNFVAMHGGSGGGPQALVGDTLSLYLPNDEIYFDIIFSSFSGGNSGGGFAWTRICK